MMMGVRGSIIPLMRLLSMGTETGLVKGWDIGDA
jgi:hypothetical protein